MKRYSVIATICIVAVLSFSFMGCNQQKEENNVNAQDESIPVVNIEGLPLPGDLYYTDPVVTKNGNLLMLGNTNHTVQQFNKRYFAVNEWLTAPVYTYNKESMYPHLSKLVTTPSWYEDNTYLYIESMTLNPETYDIYFLSTNNIPLKHYQGLYFYKDTIEAKKNQEIGVITDSSITQKLSVDSDMRFSKIRFFQESETSPAMLLLSTADGILYYTSLSSESILLDTVLPLDNTFITWDVAGDTLVALDCANQLHMFTLSTSENRLQADEINPPIPYPLSEEMTDPHLLYNPVNNCIVLWDAVSEGKCLYALKDNVNWKWKQIAVSPTALFPYNIELFSIELFSTDNSSDELPTPSLYEPSLLFSCIGTDSSRVGNYYYPVYTNPYEEGDLEGIYDIP